MRKRKTILLCIIIVLVLFTFSAYSTEDKVNWNQLKDAKDLAESTKATVVEVYKNANCYAGCPDTIHQCLLDEPDNKAVQRLANFVIRRAKARRNVAEIKTDIKERAVSLYPPKTHKINIEGKQVSGDKNAKITVVSFADGECPYCRIASPALRKISQEHKGLIAYYFKQFPIKSHKHGLECARAMVAAELQNKFWELHDIVYRNYDHLAEAELRTYATKAGLDLKKYDADLKSRAVLDIIRKDKSEGVALNIVGTPGIFINGKFYKGIKTYEELLDILEEEKDIVEGLQ